MRVFLDTSALSENSVGQLAVEISDRLLSGDTFTVSVLSHFQILWGYHLANLSPRRYEHFLGKLSIDIASVLKEDAELAAEKRPRRRDLVDALISSAVMRYEGSIWTRDADFFRFLPKEKIRLL